MKKVIVSFVSATALASISMAMAGGMTSTVASDDQASNNPAGVYISGDLGYGSVNNYFRSTDFTGAAPRSFKNGAFAWAANLGYQFNPYVALEAGYMTFGQAKVSVTPTSGAGFTNTVSFGGFDGVVKGMLPIGNAFSLFAKAGAIDMHATGVLTHSAAGYTLGGTHAHGNTWMPLAGAGAAYNVNSNVAVTVEDDYAFQTRFTQNNVRTTMPGANDILAGVSYKFVV